MSESRGPVRVERGPKRVRALVEGRTAVDTLRPLLVWEKRSYPIYYVPVEDVRGELVDTGRTHHSPGRGDGHIQDLHLPDGLVVPEAALIYPEPEVDVLREHVRFAWAKVDAWFEEDEEVFVHPRDPYVRVDALPSSRHVVVERDGITLAESTRPLLLFETGLVTRTYLPRTDVRLDLLVTSDTVTRCPYKGMATYYHLRADDVHVDDVAWSYPFPTRESLPIAGLVCFHDEQVDLILDGSSQPRPERPFRTDHRLS